MARSQSSRKRRSTRRKLSFISSSDKENVVKITDRYKIRKEKASRKGMKIIIGRSKQTGTLISSSDDNENESIDCFSTLEKKTAEWSFTPDVKRNHQQDICSSDEQLSKRSSDQHNVEDFSDMLANISLGDDSEGQENQRSSDEQPEDCSGMRISSDDDSAKSQRSSDEQPDDCSGMAISVDDDLAESQDYRGPGYKAENLELRKLNKAFEEKEKALQEKLKKMSNELESSKVLYHDSMKDCVNILQERLGKMVNQPQGTKNINRQTKIFVMAELYNKLNFTKTVLQEVFSELQNENTSLKERLAEAQEQNEQVHRKKEELVQQVATLKSQLNFHNVSLKDNTQTEAKRAALLDSCKAVRPGHHPGTDEVYKMTAFPRGITLIINNSIFEDHQEHGKQSPRHGSEEDVRQVQALFADLGFEVHLKENLTRVQLLNELDSVACQDHSGYDCFVLWLMSHGKSGLVFCSDGVLLPIQSAQDVLNNCKTLRGKPKLVFIQACRGNEEVEGFSIMTDRPSPIHTHLDPHGHVDQPSEEDNPSASGFSHTHADFLYSYATVDGHVSYRCPDLGSYYVRSLVDVFRERATHDDLLGILTTVNRKVNEMVLKMPALGNNSDGKNFKQMPEMTSTLRKKLRF